MNCVDKIAEGESFDPLSVSIEGILSISQSALMISVFVCRVDSARSFPFHLSSISYRSYSTLHFFSHSSLKYLPTILHASLNTIVLPLTTTVFLSFESDHGDGISPIFIARFFTEPWSEFIAMTSFDPPLSITADTVSLKFAKIQGT